MATATQNADETWFELYDLKVEVVVPDGKRVLCGSKPGDHFTRQGEKPGHS
jgi:hypothetical protein